MKHSTGYSAMLCRGVIALVLLCSSNLVSSQPALRGQDDKAASTSTEQVQERALQVNSLREKFQTAKAQYYQKLHQDYGEEYTVKLFSDVHPTIEGRQTTVGRTMFLQGTPNAQVSWDRLVRKMTSKLIDAQQGGSSPPTFVWSTGGHSASAGHGNFFDESYTNVLDRNAAPVFKAVGIDFKARSYAMGGTSSGVEIASCAKEIFGLDADIVSWDYGMCDGRNYERTEFYAQRISMIPTRPAVVMLQTNNDRGRLGVMERLTDRGMTALGMADSVLSQRDQLFPDCAELDMSVIETLPKFIRNYRCGNAIEKQEPLCGQEKFSSNGQEVCDKRKFKTSWHPGWKWHAYRGHAYALFLMEILDDALTVFETQAQGDPAVFVQTIREAEAQNYTAFQSNTNYFRPDAYKFPDVSLETLYTSPNYCHTARLAAETRYQGILTGRKGLLAQNTYDGGTEVLKARSETDTAVMPLVYDANERQKCEIPVQVDFKDFFLTSGKFQNYVSLTLPNDSEVAAYGQHDLKGVIALCPAACGWRCPADTIWGIEKVSYRVNGEDVHNMTDFDGCHLLQRSDKSHIWPKNQQGRFEISAKVHEEKEIMRISTFLLW